MRPGICSRLLVIVVAVIGLLAFSGSSDAADFDHVEAWWNSLDCPQMNGAVNAYDDSLDAEGMDSGYCAMYDGLGSAEVAVVNRAAGEIGGDYDSIQLWWTALNCRKMIIATGSEAYCGHFMNAPGIPAEAPILTAAQEVHVGQVGYALARGVADADFAVITASSLWKPFAAATPALPLVGLGILGALLAGRGARLLRRDRR